MALRCWLLLIRREERFMTHGIELTRLSNQELAALEQAILSEESRRVMSSATAIVVEPDAPEAAHLNALQQLLSHALA
jgi:hypothetical protein